VFDEPEAVLPNGQSLLVQKGIWFEGLGGGVFSWGRILEAGQRWGGSPASGWGGTYLTCRRGRRVPVGALLAGPLGGAGEKETTVDPFLVQRTSHDSVTAQLVF